MGLSLLHAGLPSGSAAPAQVVPLFTGVKDRTFDFLNITRFERSSSSA
jgi:hypothetical protein